MSSDHTHHSLNCSNQAYLVQSIFVRHLTSPSRMGARQMYSGWLLYLACPPGRTEPTIFDGPLLSMISSVWIISCLHGMSHEPIRFDIPQTIHVREFLIDRYSLDQSFHFSVTGCPSGRTEDFAFSLVTICAIDGATFECMLSLSIHWGYGMHTLSGVEYYCC